MAVNGIELAVGQKWKTRGGQEVEIVSSINGNYYPWDLSNGACVKDSGAVWDDASDSSDLITLIQDEHGFTPWNGGECPVSVGVEVEVKLRDGYKTTDDAGNFHWNHNYSLGDITAYRVVKQTEQTKEITVETATEVKEEPKYTVKEVFDAINTETDYIAPFSSIERVQKHLARINHPDYNLYLQLKAKFE